MKPVLASTNTNPSGKTSVTLILVAFAIPVLFTVIVKLTRVLFPTKVTLAVLLTVNMTGIALIDELLLMSVLFSLHVTLTVLVKVPLAMTFNVIVKMYESPGLIKPIVNKPVALSYPVAFELTNSNPSGTTSVILTPVALEIPSFVTLIVNTTLLLTVTFSPTLTLEVLLTFKSTTG